MSNRAETLEGFVIDIACVRKYPHEALLKRAREHTKQCALMGHCVESGYGLINDRGQAALLDSEATQLVVGAVGRSVRDRGIRLRAVREMHGEEMKTTAVEEV